MFSSAGWKAGSLPPLRLPLFYAGFSTLCFALALIGAMLHAPDLTGFYYHPHILALTHLITLGWITGNIFGFIYIVSPMALQIYLPATKLDWIAFGLFAIGVSGMVAHFWRDLPVGMVWSAFCVYAAVVFMVIKVLIAVSSSKVPGFVKMHVIFAFSNFFFAASWGILIGIHKVTGFLPTSTSPNVIAHAHLAAVGWATMLIFGLSYRLLPMFLPAQPVKGTLPWLSGILLECGLAGFFVCTLIESPERLLCAILMICGVLIFFANAIRIVRKRKAAPPPEIRRPDFSMLHAPVAFLCLLICCVAGLFLLDEPANEKTLQWALAYACLALVGFISQLIIGLKPKILSVFVWYHAFARNNSVPLPRPVDMPVRTFQIIVFALWLIALPLLVSGLALAKAFLIIGGATLLLASIVLSTLHEWTILNILRNKTTSS